MAEKRVAEERQHEGQERDLSATDEIRVTDRRRINIDGAVKTEGGAEETEAAGSAASFKPTYVEQLEMRARIAEQKVADVQARFEQLRLDLQRETDATRQRLNRAASERAASEKMTFISQLLPVIDNLRRAIEAAESNSSIESLLSGLHGTLNGFENALTAAGVEPVSGVGAPFDPERHEAVDIIDVSAEQDRLITAEYARGYKVGDRLLRPARVQVGRATTAEQRHQAAE